MTALKMNHPKATSDNSVAVVGPILVAQGGGAQKGSQDVFGIVYSDAKGQQPVTTGERLPSKTPGQWGLLFRRLPVSSQLLAIYSTNTGTLVATLSIRVGAIEPYYPQDNDIVPTYFYAYGEIDENTEPTSSINTDPTATGMLIYGPPSTPDVYLFDYADVPTGVGRTLTIQSDSTSYTTITISDEV